MKSNLIAVTLAGVGSLLLAGCQDSGADMGITKNPTPDGGVDQQTLQANILNEINADQAQARELLRELQKNDPTVRDVYFSMDGNGNKVVNVARENPDGTITTWQSDALSEQVPGYGKQDEATGGSGMGSALLAGAGGALMGYMLANMFMNRGGSMANHPSASQYDQNKQQAKRQYQSSVAQNQRQRMSGLGSAANTSQTRARGAFAPASSTTSSRSSSYGSGG